MDRSVGNSRNSLNSHMTKHTLVTMLIDRAERHGDRLAFASLEDGVAVSQRWTYGDLHLRAKAIAAQLQSIAAPGARALLMYPAGLEFLAGFFGCLYASVIAVPVPPPEASRLKRTGPRLRSIAGDAQTSLVLTTAKIRELISQADPPVFAPGTMSILCTDSIETELADRWREPTLDGSELAYLQYTSGSTSTPKGVMISHRSVCSHLVNLQRMCDYNLDSVTVTWMPYFHDYGLVEGLLEPLYNATPCYVMSPFAFVKRPVAWLRSLSQFRGTHSQAPNFAYDLCAKRISPDQREGLDLQYWRSAGNAAEPINPKVLTAFYEAFRDVGFKWSAFCPAYGLAEATLLVSSSQCGGKPLLMEFNTAELEKKRAVESHGGGEATRTMVGCGRIFDTTNVAIVDPETRARCAPYDIGEIWVSDPAVADGYWQRPEDTATTFRAYTSGEREGPFLRTGDLGFVRDGELFIAGRLKDLVIVRGTNHYPQDIEWTVQASHPSLRPENGAAFSVVVDGQERLVIAQELEREYVSGFNAAEVAEAIRQAIGAEHEIDVFAVLFLNRGSIPKTASGKIQRQACRKFYLDGGSDVVDSWIAPIRTTADVPAWLLKTRANTMQRESVPQPPSMDGHHSALAVGSSIETSGRKANELIAWLRSYASERINSRLMDERRCIPPYIILDLGNRGALGLQVAESYGGLGLRYRDMLRVLEQLGAIDLNLAAVVFLHNSNGVRPIQYYATKELRDELLPLLARGRELAAFALSEPGAGSNVGGIASLALPQPSGGWRLHGVKRWNAASWAGVVSVFVRAVERTGRLGGLTGFAVRQGAPGLRIGPEALTTGLRGSVQNSIFLNDVLVGGRDVLGAPGKGMDVADDALMVGRICTAAVSLGALKRCAQLMTRYAERRTVATGRLIENPVTLAKLGELTALITAIECFLSQIAGLMDRRITVPGEIAMAVKILASDAAVWAAGELMQLLGGRGYMENNIAPQILRDARVLTVGEGPNETLAWYIGRSISQARVIHHFIAESLEMPAIANRLDHDVNQVRELCEGSCSRDRERSAVVSWECYVVGKLAGEGLLLASVEAAALRHPRSRMDRVLTWARLRYDEALRQALRIATGDDQVLCQRDIGELSIAWAESIGDIEQDLPGEEQALDPLLRKTPETVPGIRPTALPGDLRLSDELEPDSDATVPRMTNPLERLSVQAKRELLESALRSRIEAEPSASARDA